MNMKTEKISVNNPNGEQELTELALASENNEDAEAGRLSDGNPDLPPGTTPLANEQQPRDLLLAEETSMNFSTGDETFDADPPLAGYGSVLEEYTAATDGEVNAEDDVQKKIDEASNDKTNHTSNNDQGDMEALPAKGNHDNCEEEHDHSAETFQPVKICQGDEAPVPTPPQYLEEQVVGSDSVIENKTFGRGQTCLGDEPHMPPQYLEGEEIDRSRAKKKRLPLGSEQIHPSPSNIANVETHEDTNDQLPIPPEPNTPNARIQEDLRNVPPQRQVPEQWLPEQPDHPTPIPNGAPSNPPVPFYEVEARLVVESESDDQRRGTVYDAVPIQDPPLQPNLPVSWWQRHQRTIFITGGIAIILIAGSVVAIGVLTGRPPPTNPPALMTPPPPASTTPPTTPTLRAPPSSTQPTETPIPTTTPTIPPPPPVHGISNVTHLGDFLETDCEDKCLPVVAIDEDYGETALVAPQWSQYIQILNKTTNGIFEGVQRIDVNFHPRSLAIFDDQLIVGSPWESLETGAVYVYERNSSGLWNQMQRIVAADNRQDAEFGFSVDIYKDAMVIGAYQDREGKIGSVYIYRRKDANWVLERKIAPHDDGKIENFGMAIAIRRDRIVVGDRAYAGNKTASDPKKGAVWVYEHDASSEDWIKFNGVMTNDDCENWFGASLAFTYDYGLLIGCPLSDNKAGAVFYYEASDSSYIFRQKVVASDGGWPDKIGDMDQLSVHGNVMVVGTDKAKNGRVYVFLRINNVWVETEKVASPEESRKFGKKIAMSGNHIAVSSKRKAHFYQLVQGPPTVSCISKRADRVIFKSDCKRCNPFVAIDGDAIVVSKNKESVQILSRTHTKMSLFGVDHDFGGVAISGDVAVTGAPGVNSRSGSVIVYQKLSDIWFESAQLSPNVVGYRDNFGGAVDLDGDVVIVGAYDYKVNKGAAYTFRRNESGPWSGWVQEAKLLPNDPKLQGFGRAVSVIDNTVAIGDRIYKDSSGAVFVYVYGQSSKAWDKLNDTITNDDCDAMFGSSLALTRDNGLLIGCPGEEGYTGAVYYYIQDKSGSRYVLQQKIQPLNGALNDKFGDSDQIAVDGDIMVVGTDKLTNGTVHVFAQINYAWIEVNAIEAPPKSEGFGHKVALSGRSVLISSMYNVYSYTLEDC